MSAAAQVVFCTTFTQMAGLCRAPVCMMFIPLCLYYLTLLSTEVFADLEDMTTVASHDLVGGSQIGLYDPAAQARFGSAAAAAGVVDMPHTINYDAEAARVVISASRGHTNIGVEAVAITPEASEIPAIEPPAASAEAPAPAPESPLVVAVVASLRARGHYGAIAGAIDTLDGSVINSGMTFFAPTDDALSSYNLTDISDNILILEHCVNRRLNYTELTGLSTGTQLATLSRVHVLVTNNSPTNFHIDNARVIDPDIYLRNGIAVHGIDVVFNLSAYSNETFTLPPTTITTDPEVVPSSQVPADQLPPRTSLPPSPSPLGSAGPTSATAVGSGAAAAGPTAACVAAILSTTQLAAGMLLFYLLNLTF